MLYPELRAANQARLLMEVLAYNPAQGAGHLMREFYLKGEQVKRLIKVGARVSYHGRRWLVHMASSRVLRGIPLGHHYPEVLGRRLVLKS